MKKKYILFFLSSLLIFSFILPVDSFQTFVNQNVMAATAPAKKKKTTTKKKTTSAKKSTTKKTTTRKRTTRKKTTSKKASSTTDTKPKETPQNDPLTLLVNETILSWMPQNLNPGGLRVNQVNPVAADKRADISLNENFTYLPVTKDLIEDLKKQVSLSLPDSISDYDINFKVGNKNYAFYITTIDKLPEQYRKNKPFVSPVEPYVKADRGMEGDIIALWPSHGRYFKPGSSAWYWQRPQLFQVTEDTHTMSYIFPYVAPMIENAGGYVFLPRERDINRNEVIVDNDTNDEGQIFSQPYYKEITGSKKWNTGEGEGFIYDLPDFRDTENPFENGTYRQTSSVTGGKLSYAVWCADIPEDGEYAVYVSYKSLPNSVEDARYTINYSGGSREFKVNQTMGGGTWIYLGTFPFEAGFSEEEPVVILSNLSSKEGKTVTADAVKIGGGMGNISRSDSRQDVYEAANDSLAVDDVYAYKFSTSGLPRYLEGARYWLQWAGMPEEIYSPYHGEDDYKDDYTSRGLWVNYLAGGSRVLPDRKGLNIPVDVTMALHSDAGKKADDSFIGTLGIYFTNDGDSYIDGTPRSNSRTLTDMLLRQITQDIRQTWEPEWTRRALWDKTYVEARVPEVPTSLIEFMSHQNFADMKYALDPDFRFTVSRAIYKAIGRFVSERKDRKFVVQPLPVKDFAIEKEKKGVYKLSWSPVHDPLEPTASPEKFIIFERTADELGFHKIGETGSTHFNVKIKDKDIHSFRIVAANDGGLSFPSETLALRESDDNLDPVLIINGFNRVSGPESFSIGDEAGFNSQNDFGVPYIRDISFIGYQNEFRRNSGEAFGKSDGNYASRVIAGNTFDYSYLHGSYISITGKGFVSASAGAVEAGNVDLNDYKIIDLILGKQKTSVMGNGFSGMRYSTFPDQLRIKLENFSKHGGKIFVSGEYVASDASGMNSPSASRQFIENVLGVRPSDGAKSFSGTLKTKSNSLYSVPTLKFGYSNSLNDKTYIVENPDILLPSGVSSAESFLEFGDTGESAGYLVKNGTVRNVVMSVPFEAIDESARASLMKMILDFLER